MVSEGDTAPGFTAPLANGDIEEFTLSERLEEGPIILAFFPAAFSSVCSHEMTQFRDRQAEFEEMGTAVYGVSVDLPFSLNQFRDELDLSFGLISDPDRELISAYDISMDFDELGVPNVAKRSVFVVNTDGEITYAWVSDDPGVEPSYEEIQNAADRAG